jgi:hypothetical protein
MSHVRVRLNPTRDETETDVVITMSLPRPLQAWELMDLCETLRARSQSAVRVVLPAVAPSDWLDRWCEVLAEAVIGRIEVQFTASRKPRRRAERRMSGESPQLEVEFMRSRGERLR